MPAGGIDYITIKGFKSIKLVEKLELGPITVLIGPNGSGKSNFIEVFSLLRAIREGELQQHVRRFGGADNTNILKSYRKPRMGLLAVQSIGLDTIRRECPLFNQWMTRLERAAQS